MMLPSQTTQLQPGSVRNMALEIAKGKAGVAKWFLWIGGFFVFAVIAMALDRSSKFAPSGQSTSEIIGGGLFWVALLWGIGAIFLRKASRARKIAEAAASSPTLHWYLNGFMIVAADERNVPLPDLSFKLNQRLVTMLTTVPEVRARPFDR